MSGHTHRDTELFACGEHEAVHATRAGPGIQKYGPQLKTTLQSSDLFCVTGEFAGPCQCDARERAQARKQGPLGGAEAAHRA
ncbi:Uncharacterised protein [Mycobacteroides abscessus subsp. abscessus]|nr:Uncharacterised protein [Mycobacteroides abscessus subsp. abscessus]